MKSSIWSEMQRNWDRIPPPLRPPSAATKTISDLIEPLSDRGVLLGVTPEFSRFGEAMTAYDRAPMMLENIWPGDTETHKAVQSDWLNLPEDDGAVSFCIGDGSPNTCLYPDSLTAFYKEAARILQPGGLMIMRVFSQPDNAVTMDDVMQRFENRGYENPSALRLAVYACLASKSAKSTVQLHEAADVIYERLGEPGEMSKRAGYDPDETKMIMIHKSSDDALSIPKTDLTLEIASQFFSTAKIVSSGDYHMSDHCPLLVATK
ncbi:MAG: hypothetical protein AAGF28_03375 [Pseudomonadota bacterium]